jgi:hypothetical protein
LPSLTSVKESKLSKDTIVDESLKYHKTQEARLEHLQKTVDALKVEKEALLAELSGWRECLYAMPLRAEPAELLEANVIHNDTAQLDSHDLMPMYGAIVVPASDTTFEVPTTVPSYSTQADFISIPVSGPQTPDDYTLPSSTVVLADEPSLDNPPRTSPYLRLL